MPRRRARSLGASLFQRVRHRRSPFLPILLLSITFIFALFYSGYSSQQKSLHAIQDAIPPRPKFIPRSNLLPPDPGLHDDEDDELSSSEVVTTGPVAGWRPRKGVNGEDLGLSGANPAASAREKKPPPKKPYAYIQIANHPHHVCSALMTLARVHDLSTVGVLVLLYPRHWDDDSSLGLARGIREEQLKLELRRKALQRDSRNRGAAAPTWVAGEYRPPQDQTLIFPGTWPGERYANRWERSARRMLLSAITRYGVQLMPVDPLPISSFFPRYSSEVDLDALPHEIHLPASGSLSSTAYARSRTTSKLTSALTRVITPLHLFNLTQFSRIIYLSPLGLPMKNLDKLVTQLPPSTRIATPRTYWTHNKNRRKSCEFSPHFWVMKPSHKIFSILLSHLLHTQHFESWLGTVTPRATTDEIHIVAITGGWHGLGLAYDLANEVLEDVFSPSTALVLPAHPWHVPIFEDEYPTTLVGRRHGGLLGKDGRWDPGRVREETHFVVFTGPRRPWEVWGAEGGMGEWEREWLRRYAGVRRDVCLLDLEPVGKRHSLV
ncbi:hypothetical protein L211DRAFT_841589 [Terfezia boudieri ATCC MYA-4762]|uniref:Uncharacterized protein n=1 Tax=Terfezia boudieri ATCC MYA-4762 TaxID=1051890 RepID=A0A3N4LG90_9PEZI|nr:hypothetical protein L211DRAFT_841589 [Terfezia boudieri ATCC MYA-4762]